jgi:AraC-like DNA-binding protein
MKRCSVPAELPFKRLHRALRRRYRIRESKGSSIMQLRTWMNRSLASASQGIFVSPSRLRHLFVEQTGLAFRTYTLWLRLMRAMQIYSQGNSLTEAAHLAGFADSAHFSRIFRRTFGLPATTLTRL